MIKSLMIGLWSGATALGGAYLAMILNTAAPEHGAESQDGPTTIEFIKSDNLSVPIIRGGKVTGYVVTEMSFAVDKAKEGGGEANPAPYLVDAAYRTIYENLVADFEHLKPQDLKDLSDKVKENANKRLGKETVQDVLISNINFVARDEIRKNWVKEKQSAAH